MTTYCTAATGIGFCKFWNDQAHRCELEIKHPRIPTPVIERLMHKCICGYRWTCLTGSLDDYDMTPREARHEVQERPGTDRPGHGGG